MDVDIIVRLYLLHHLFWLSFNELNIMQIFQKMMSYMINRDIILRMKPVTFPPNMHFVTLSTHLQSGGPSPVAPSVWRSLFIHKYRSLRHWVLLIEWTTLISEIYSLSAMNMFSGVPLKIPLLLVLYVALKSVLHSTHQAILFKQLQSSLQ